MIQFPPPYFVRGFVCVLLRLYMYAHVVASGCLSSRPYPATIFYSFILIGFFLFLHYDDVMQCVDVSISVLLCSPTESELGLKFRSQFIDVFCEGDTLC